MYAPADESLRHSRHVHILSADFRLKGIDDVRVPTMYIVGCPCLQVLHVGVKLILFRQSASLWSLLGFGATSLIYIVCYASLAGMAGVDLTICPNMSLSLFPGD